MPRRILMLSTALGVGGGAEEQVMLLSLGLRARGWLVKIVSLLPLFPISAELEASDIPISSLGMTRGIPDPRAMFSLINELRSFHPDVVHCHMPQANLLARAVRPFCPFPVLISTLHNLTMERINGSSGRFLELAHRFTDRYSDLTTVICTPALHSYVARRAVPADKITVFYNGVDTRNFQADPMIRCQMRRDLQLGEETFAWLAIGRFERAKDYPNLIRAFAKVVRPRLARRRDPRPSARLWLGGACPVPRRPARHPRHHECRRRLRYVFISGRSSHGPAPSIFCRHAHCRHRCGRQCRNCYPRSQWLHRSASR